jgi:hypothetical protein
MKYFIKENIKNRKYRNQNEIVSGKIKIKNPNFIVNCVDFIE